MLFLVFQLGKDRYAVEANRVVEVLPLLELKRIPQAPRGIAGIFNLRGRPVPALDLTELTFGQPARERLTTRIILIQHADAEGQPRFSGSSLSTSLKPFAKTRPILKTPASLSTQRHIWVRYRWTRLFPFNGCTPSILCPSRSANFWAPIY